MKNVAPAPAAAPAAIDPVQLRRSLGCFVTGVTIVTTCSPSGEPVGLTINSFSSVSLAPPLVLWSLSLRAASFETFLRAPHFAINVLAAEHQSLAQRFAQTGGDKFTDAAWRRGVANLPCLDGAVARFVCRNAQQHPGGDHVVFIGEVLAHEHNGGVPLVYAGGRYVRVEQG